jgi:isocitrate dehydrogenase
MSSKLAITLAKGDGIGPEIMDSVLHILNCAGARLEYDIVEVGEKAYLAGNSTGITDKDWETIKKNRVFLKAPITTPQGGGYKSLNVTIRKTLGQYSNVRPCHSYHPFVKTNCKNLDVVIVRENEEDLYAGIEYRQTANSYQAIKLLSRQGSEKIIRYAFDYAVKNNRKRITCMVKDNIMKICDGMFAEIFAEVGKEYPQIEQEKYIIDIGAARLATKPDHFDVVVTLNLYGDIVSDIVAEVSGSVGLAGSGNIGSKYAMFEAIHGSAPAIAGKNKANPSGLLNGAIMMLAHIGQGDIAGLIHNAFLYTIENGIATYDIYQEGISTKLCGTKEFGHEIAENLGKMPQKFKPVSYKTFDFSNDFQEDISVSNFDAKFNNSSRQLVGVDVFVSHNGTTTHLVELLQKITDAGFALHAISSRGLNVYSSKSGMTNDIVGDFWQCRFVGKSDIVSFLAKFSILGLDFTKIECLYYFNGQRCYSLGQGE